MQKYFCHHRYAIIYEKGYQKFGGIQSSVTTKLKGVVSTESVADGDFRHEIDNQTIRLYKRMWDTSDLVVPASVKYYI